MVFVAAAAGIAWAAQPGAKTRAADVTGATATHLRSASSPTLRSFGWLTSTTPPPTWVRLTVPSGLGTLSSPPGFRTVDGDPGTLTVALLNPAGTYLGYLNVTPRQGPETLQDWHAFRLTHLGRRRRRLGPRGRHGAIGPNRSGDTVMCHRRLRHDRRSPSISTRWPVTSRAALSAASWSPPRHQVIPAMSGPNWSAPSWPIRSNRVVRWPVV